MITCLPSTVSNPRSCSSQSASRGRPSSHNSPFTLLTSAPFTLQAEMTTLLYHLSKNKNNNRTHFCKMNLPDTLSNKERCGDTSCSLYCPAVSQLDTEASFWNISSPLIAMFFPKGLKDSQSLR